MAGKGEGKIHLGKGDVYLHVKGKSKAIVTHLDVELDEINYVIYPGEKVFTGGKKGGVFIALNREMITRAEKLAKEKTKKTHKKDN